MRHRSRLPEIAPNATRLEIAQFPVEDGVLTEEQLTYAIRVRPKLSAEKLLKIIEDLRVAGVITTDLPKNPIAEILNSAMHTEQGYLLARKWNLPETYCALVRDHHQEPSDPGNTLLLFVRLADQVCEKTGSGLSGDPEISLAATLEAQILGLGEIPLAELEILIEDSVALADRISRP